MIEARARARQRASSCLRTWSSFAGGAGNNARSGTGGSATRSFRLGMLAVFDRCHQPGGKCG